jgi:high-affinity iron transporter
VLAVVFAGKGIAALQEAGVINAYPVKMFSLPLLGIYPNLQALAIQGLTLALVLAGFAYNHWSTPSTPNRVANTASK